MLWWAYLPLRKYFRVCIPPYFTFLVSNDRMQLPFLDKQRKLIFSQTLTKQLRINMCVGKRAFSKRNSIDHAHNQRMRLPVARRGTASFSIAITCIMGYTWEIGQHSISHAWQEYACVYYFIVKEDWGWPACRYYFSTYFGDGSQ